MHYSTVYLLAVAGCEQRSMRLVGGDGREGMDGFGGTSNLWARNPPCLESRVWMPQGEVNLTMRPTMDS